ncbi:DUF2934 domain-containing protein [Burkholderia multivorans]|nr:DUF2934 domain-containing protein [Burkholderia multivorans]MBU9286110.1 DUF2934 domain-containing protein [Burkholderia multivorans]
MPHMRTASAAHRLARRRGRAPGRAVAVRSR